MRFHANLRKIQKKDLIQFGFLWFKKNVYQTRSNDIGKRLKESKSKGPEQINHIILKECALEFSIPLTFRELIQQEKVQNSWRLANISPIDKKGPRTLRSYYR